MLYHSSPFFPERSRQSAFDSSSEHLIIILMAGMKGLVMIIVTMLAMMAVMRGTDGAINCGTVTSAALQCSSYLIGNDAAPSGVCCGRVRALNAAAKSVPDRRTACGCIKNLYNSLHPNLSKASSLAPKCNVNLGFTISPKMNCNAIH